MKMLHFSCPASAGLDDPRCECCGGVLPAEAGKVCPDCEAAIARSLEQERGRWSLVVNYEAA